MGLADRDYMKESRRAAPGPSRIARARFALWLLWKRLKGLFRH